MIDNRLDNKLIFAQHEMVAQRYRNLLTFMLYVTGMMVNIMRRAGVMMMMVMINIIHNHE